MPTLLVSVVMVGKNKECAMTFFQMIESLVDEGSYAYRESKGQHDCFIVVCCILGGIQGSIFYNNGLGNVYEFSKDDFYADDWKIVDNSMNCEYRR
jgi:hypothetical protein